MELVLEDSRKPDPQSNKAPGRLSRWVRTRLVPGLQLWTERREGGRCSPGAAQGPGTLAHKLFVHFLFPLIHRFLPVPGVVISPLHTRLTSIVHLLLRQRRQSPCLTGKPNLRHTSELTKTHSAEQVREMG